VNASVPSGEEYANEPVRFAALTVRRRIRSYDPDREYDEPNRLPIARGRRYGYDCKEFSDLLNSLKRYLRSCIGQPWNKVHSELSRKLDRRSLSGSHIWDHLLEVENLRGLQGVVHSGAIESTSGHREALAAAAPGDARLYHTQWRSTLRGVSNSTKDVAAFKFL
jgi:hypothetical protein